MNIPKDIVTPDGKGKIFTTDANDAADLKNIKTQLLQIPEIKEVKINGEVFPSQIHIFTSQFLRVTEIQELVKKTGFHILATDIFPSEIRN
jgi:hypothetical protein